MRLATQPLEGFDLQVGRRRDRRERVVRPRAQNDHISGGSYRIVKQDAQDVDVLAVYACAGQVPSRPPGPALFNLRRGLAFRRTRAVDAAEAAWRQRAECTAHAGKASAGPDGLQRVHGNGVPACRDDVDPVWPELLGDSGLVADPVDGLIRDDSLEAFSSCGGCRHLRRGRRFLPRRAASAGSRRRGPTPPGQPRRSEEDPWLAGGHFAQPRIEGGMEPIFLLAEAGGLRPVLRALRSRVQQTAVVARHQGGDPVRRAGSRFARTRRPRRLLDGDRFPGPDDTAGDCGLVPGGDCEHGHEAAVIRAGGQSGILPCSRSRLWLRAGHRPAGLLACASGCERYRISVLPRRCRLVRLPSTRRWPSNSQSRIANVSPESPTSRPPMGRSRVRQPIRHAAGRDWPSCVA